MDPLWINPQGATRGGLIIDGLIPDDMRRNGSFATPPPNQSPYHWEGIQGLVMAARILDLVGHPIWELADRALYRAVLVLQDTYELTYGGWRAEGDDQWMLPFFDQAYGSNWSAAYDPCTSRVFEHGKNAGWGWVTLSSTIFADGFETGTTAAWSS